MLDALTQLVFEKPLTALSVAEGAELAAGLAVLALAIDRLWLRPFRDRPRQARRRAVAIGEPVVTGDGILGRVAGLAPDTVLVELPSGQRIAVAREAIAIATPDENGH